MNVARWFAVVALVVAAPAVMSFGAPSETATEDESFSVEELHSESTYLVLCTRAGGDAWLDVARRLATKRMARAIVVFDADRPEDLLPLMREFEPEYVAYVIPPRLITPHLSGQLAELSSRIQPDKLIDYASGYVTGVTPGDAITLIERTLTREDAEVPIPRMCTGVGHSWYDMRGVHLILASRETGRGPTLKLTDAEGESIVLNPTADVTIVESMPDQNYQVRGVNRRLMLSPNDGARCLIAFEPAEIDSWESGRWKNAMLKIPVDATRWRFSSRMVLGVSPLQNAWNESSASWHDAPAFDRETTATVPVDATTTIVSVDVTSLLKDMEHGVALFCHSTDDKTVEPLRHMYRFMTQYVDECRENGFDGVAVEALSGTAWTENHHELLAPLSKGGLILFGGHGSGSKSCLVGAEDLSSLEIGPSVVLNGTCFGATTHQVVNYGDAIKPHFLLRTLDPAESFALQMLRRGSLGCIGGSTNCSFGHVQPAIALLRDEHMSLGRAIRAIQNGFIEQVSADSWDAGGMRPGDPGFAKVDHRRAAHPTMIQYTIRTICLGDPAFVPFPK